MSRDRKARILLVEGEGTLRGLHTTILTKKGYSVTAFGTLIEADSEMRRVVYDMAILDVASGANMKGDIEQIDLWRGRGEAMPIIAISTDASAAIPSFEKGADDFMKKPFKADELAHRVARHLQRYFELLRLRQKVQEEEKAALKAGGGYLPEKAFTFGKAKIGRDLTITFGTKTSRLSVKQSEILEYLAKHAGKTVVKEQLLRAVWGLQNGSGEGSLAPYLSGLRKLFRENGQNFDKLVQNKARIGWAVSASAVATL
jgi:DNA-binding response OmpR family regulator